MSFAPSVISNQHSPLAALPQEAVLIAKWWIQLTSATLEFVFAPGERDVYRYGRPRKDLAPVGAKPGSGTTATQGKSGCAPTELRSKERTAGYKHLALWGEAANNVLLHFQIESANTDC
jgi:hypothetical protein